MLALAVPFLVEHLRLPSWLVKVALAILAACLLLIAVAIGAWQLRIYAEHTTQAVATQAASAAKAEVAAAVNAASEAALRDQHEAEVREMAKLAVSDASSAAMWAALDQTLSSIPETADASPTPVPLMLGVVPPVGDVFSRRPGAAPARVQTVRAVRRFRPRVPGFAAFVAADRDADRLLERASAGTP